VPVTPQMQMKIFLYRRSRTVFKFHHLNSSRRTSDVSKVSVNEASGSLSYALSSDDEVSVN
jgi:hypothetical protein